MKESLHELEDMEAQLQALEKSITPYEWEVKVN